MPDATVLQTPLRKGLFSYRHTLRRAKRKEEPQQETWEVTGVKTK
jgi:hypothetical protein